MGQGGSILGRKETTRRKSGGGWPNGWKGTFGGAGLPAASVRRGAGEEHFLKEGHNSALHEGSEKEGKTFYPLGIHRELTGPRGWALGGRRNIKGALSKGVP